MVTKIATYLLITWGVCIALGIIVESHRHLLIPIGMIALFLSFAIERLTRKSKRGNMSAMVQRAETWVTICVPSGDLRISDRWTLAGGATIHASPQELTVTTTFLEDNQCRVVKSIELVGRAQEHVIGKENIAVDTGWLYFGDARLFEYGMTSKRLEKLIDSEFDQISNMDPLMVVVSDSYGRNCGVVVSTGIGDGTYMITWRCDKDIWTLNVAFL